MSLDCQMSKLEAMRRDGADFDTILETAREGLHVLDPRFHWTGIYELFPDDVLHLGAFVGAPTEHASSARQGRVRLAVAEKRNMNIPDVSLMTTTCRAARRPVGVGAADPHRRHHPRADRHRQPRGSRHSTTRRSAWCSSPMACGLLQPTSGQAESASRKRIPMTGRSTIPAAALRAVRAALARPESSRPAPASSNQDRWLRTLERQVRVLQRASAQVRRGGRAVGRARVRGRRRPQGALRTNSTLAAHPPAPGASWIGRDCGELCARALDSPEGCGGCSSAARSSATRTPMRAHQHPDGQRTYFVSALPSSAR